MFRNELTAIRQSDLADLPSEGELMSQTIEVTVSPKGETRIETKGFTGDACRNASRVLEAALGVRASEQLTSEFHTAAAAPQVTRQ